MHSVPVLTLPAASSSLLAMKVIRHTDADFPTRLQEVTAPSSLFDAEIEQRTRAILEAMHTRGDEAHCWNSPSASTARN